MDGSASPGAALGLIVVALALVALARVGDADEVVEPPGFVAAPDAGVSGPVDVRTATAAELEAVRGIGPALAGRIVELRREQGVERAEDLLAVRGIGPRTLARIRAGLRFGEDAGVP